MHKPRNLVEGLMYTERGWSIAIIDRLEKGTSVVHLGQGDIVSVTDSSVIWHMEGKYHFLAPRSRVLDLCSKMGFKLKHMYYENRGDDSLFIYNIIETPKLD